jgi:serine/threonine protein kinase
MAIHVGTLVGRYEIDAELGRGAMGVVYRARDPRIDRTVAIKTISLLGLEPDAEREYRERFVVEARAAGRLSHPRIVTIFDLPKIRIP